MKNLKPIILLILLICIMGIEATAHDIAVLNSDGVNIYYNIGENTLSVTYSGSTPNWYPNEYTGNVVIPETVTYNGTTYPVTSISNSAFSGCYGLISVTIPNSIKFIGIEAFAGCSSLINITIPNSVKGIGSDTFSGCSSMTNAVIGDSVTNIGHDAFNGCSSLREVKIGNSVTRIQSDAFYGCSNLTKVNIPNSVTSIERRAFSDTGIYMNSSDGVFYVDNWACGYKGIMPSNEPLHLQEDTRGIADEAFSNLQNLEGVILPNSVTSIGDAAFMNCSGLTSATLSNTVNSIGSGAFRGCSGLTDLNIPNSVMSIGGYAFYGCSGLTNMTIGSLVTNIGSEAFYGCSALTSIKVQIDDISSFCNNAVVGLIKSSFGRSVLLIDGNGNEIHEISVPADVTSIGDQAFQNCTGLISVVMPNSVTSIGSYAFWGCNNLTNVVIPTSVTSITGSSFHDCYNLSVKVPVTDYSAFCNNQIIYLVRHNIGAPIYLIDEKGNTIEEFVIPEGVTNIGEYAFYYCMGLKNVRIPNSVTNFDGYAFEGCSDISSVIIGNGIQTIRTRAFRNCPKLTDVYCYAENVPTVNLYSFDGSTNIGSATLHVPKVSLNAYTTTEPWSQFGNIVRIKMPEHALTYMVDGNVYKTYQIEEGESILSEPYPSREGYTFSGWSEIPKTMPAHDVTVTGTFTINNYKLIYMIDDKVYKEIMYEYGASITPEPQPEGNYVTFEWKNLPQTMPAHDVVVYASYTSGIIDVMMTTQRNIRIYSPIGKKQDKLQKGLNIVVQDDGIVKKVVVK